MKIDKITIKPGSDERFCSIEVYFRLEPTAYSERNYYADKFCYDAQTLKIPQIVAAYIAHKPIRIIFRDKDPSRDLTLDGLDRYSASVIKSEQRFYKEVEILSINAEIED